MARPVPDRDDPVRAGKESSPFFPQTVSHGTGSAVRRYLSGSSVAAIFSRLHSGSTFIIRMKADRQKQTVLVRMMGLHAHHAEDRPQGEPGPVGVEAASTRPSVPFRGTAERTPSPIVRERFKGSSNAQA